MIGETIDTTPEIRALMKLEDVRVLGVQHIPMVLDIMKAGFGPEQSEPWQMDFAHIERNLHDGLQNGWVGYFHQYGMLAGTIVPCYHFNRSVRRATVVYSAVSGAMEDFEPLVEAWVAWAKQAQATHATVDFMQACLDDDTRLHFDALMQRMDFTSCWHEWSRSLV